MRTSVAIIIFNRPDLTELVFRAVAEARPPKLFLIADGPRPECPQDAETCAAARAVVERVDWDCEVHRNFADVNLGCGHRPASGISWVFDNVDEAIILEDDCVPHTTFFRYCDELLERFRDDERVMLVSGHSAFAFGSMPTPHYSYRFSQLVDTWGWATWSRAWKHYDIRVRRWPSLRSIVRGVSDHPVFVAEFAAALDEAHAKGGDVEYWDYQWALAFWERNGVAAIPSVNLVANRGFRADATHTQSPKDPYAGVQIAPIEFPLRHPPEIVCDEDLDRRAVHRHYERTSAMQERLARLVRRARRTYTSG